MKTCKDCEQELPLDAFQRSWNNRVERYVYQARCKECRKILRRGSAQESEYRKRRYWSDPDRFRAEAIEYSKRNPGRAVERNRERYQRDAEARGRILSSNLKTRTGLSHEDRDALVVTQGGCANPGCSVTEPTGRGWCVDHDHSCCPGTKTCGNCVRGVLCPGCNLALGHVADDIERLQGLIEYLTRWSERSNQLEETA